jgi:hypothetical protein
MNEIKCGDCVHLHTRKRGSPQGLKEIRSFALCGVKSIFHAEDPDLPEGAQTTTDALASLFVVTHDMLVVHCDRARRR